jgi:hypothetical protein
MTLGVHVNGPGFGESVVLSFPLPEDPTAIGWGVIDCYTSNLKDPAKNPVLRLLQEKEVGELEFLCLTHPHADHYEGMSHLFAHLNVKRFWRFGAADVKKIRNHLRLSADDTGEWEDRASEQEYASILKGVRRVQKKGAGYYKRLFDIARVYPTNTEEPLPPGVVGIYALAPESNAGDQYEKILERSLKTAPEGLLGRLDPRHNLISVVLMVNYGDTRLMLGGDALSGAWDSICFSADRVFPINCAFVKVSHHGSVHSWHSASWGEIAKDRECYAVITPYDRGQNPPPHSELVDNLRPWCRQIVLTSPALAFDPDPRIAAHNKDAKPVGGISTSSPWCSFEFNDRGQLLPPRLGRNAVILHSR